jgi:general secretion pathway protein C
MRLVPDARARAVMRAIARINVYSLAELALIALLAVQCARLVWAVVMPMGPLGDWRPAEPGGAGSPSLVLREADPFFRLSGGDDQPSVVTSLQLTLYGTRINEAAGGGSAIIAGPDGVQQSVAVGQEVVPGARLKSIAFDHVTIDRGGRAEDLYLAQDNAPPIPPPARGVPLMSQAAGPQAAGAPSSGVPLGARLPGPGRTTFAQLRSDIGFIPRIDGGRVSGLTVRAQGAGAAFRQAGLQDGDVVTAIGGRAVTGPGDIDRLAAQYAKGGTLPIIVERGTQTLPLSITIASQ